MIRSSRRQFVLGSLGAAGAALLPQGRALAAGSYPERPITFVCPWPAGGTADMTMRALCAVAAKTLGQTLIVDNKAGATHVGMEEFAQAAGIEMLHIPYKGGAPALQGVLSGEVNLLIDSSSWAPHVQAGKLPNYVAPTVLAEPAITAQLCGEETFGPVVPLFRFQTEEQVLTLANDTPFGLAAYFYSQGVQRIHRVAAALETGIVGINEGAVAAEAAPFGGVKESGYGREGSRHGLDDYLHIKYLCQGQLG